mgnify:CR=1 FL=1
MQDLAIIWDWCAFAVRWLHVITAMAWIGSSFYFIALVSRLMGCVFSYLLLLVLSLCLCPLASVFCHLSVHPLFQ